MHLNGRSLVCDLSCLLRCSLLLKALLQNWHLYFFSGASDDFLRVEVAALANIATGIFLGSGGVYAGCRDSYVLPLQIDG